MMTRRQWSAGIASSALAAPVRGPKALDDVLRSGIASRGIPAVVGMVATADKTLYQGAFGKRAAVDSIFRIASMTKAVTTVAVMQLVERGKVMLDDPMAKHLPALADLQVLDGFDAAGKPILRAPRGTVMVKHLLTHTAGFAY